MKAKIPVLIAVVLFLAGLADAVDWLTIDNWQAFIAAGLASWAIADLIS